MQSCSIFWCGPGSCKHQALIESVATIVSTPDCQSSGSWPARAACARLLEPRASAGEDGATGPAANACRELPSELTVPGTSTPSVRLEAEPYEPSMSFPPISVVSTGIHEPNAAHSDESPPTAIHTPRGEPCEAYLPADDVSEDSCSSAGDSVRLGPPTLQPPIDANAGAHNIDPSSRGVTPQAVTLTLTHSPRTDGPQTERRGAPTATQPAVWSSSPFREATERLRRQLPYLRATVTTSTQWDRVALALVMFFTAAAYVGVRLVYLTTRRMEGEPGVSEPYSWIVLAAELGLATLLLHDGLNCWKQQVKFTVMGPSEVKALAQVRHRPLQPAGGVNLDTSGRGAHTHLRHLVSKCDHPCVYGHACMPFTMNCWIRIAHHTRSSHISPCRYYKSILHFKGLPPTKTHEIVLWDSSHIFLCMRSHPTTKHVTSAPELQCGHLGRAS